MNHEGDIDNIKNYNNENCKECPFFSLEGTKKYAKVVKVYDGDTIWVIFSVDENSQHKFLKEPRRWKCRLWGINAPEISRCSEEEKKKGLKSKKILSDLILNKIVLLKCGNFDNFGRLLVKIKLESKDKNNLFIIDINEYMVENNYAIEYMTNKNIIK